ncbi:hypothetical protein ACOME3_009467 [Neoechinorhynchus agilis]
MTLQSKSSGTKCQIVKFSPQNGELVAVTSQCDSGVVILFDFPGCNELGRYQFSDHNIVSLAWRPDGLILLSGSVNGSVTCFFVPERKIYIQCRMTEIALEIYPIGCTVIRALFAFDEYPPIIANLETGCTECLRRVDQNKLKNFKFSSIVVYDGVRFVICAANLTITSDICVIQIASTYKLVGIFKIPTVDDGRIRSLTVGDARNGTRLLALSCSDLSILLYHTDRFVDHATDELLAPDEKIDLACLGPTGANITSMFFSNYGEHLIAIDQLSGTLRVWACCRGPKIFEDSDFVTTSEEPGSPKIAIDQHPFFPIIIAADSRLKPFRVMSLVNILPSTINFSGKFTITDFTDEDFTEENSEIDIVT